MLIIILHLFLSPYLASSVPDNSDLTIFTDPDVVFIGPGYDDLSEVLLLPSLTPALCTPPPFPYGQYKGYVGRLSPDGPLLCGGRHSIAPQSSCYLLGRDGSWVTSSSQMTDERDQAAAVELGDSWWVTGNIIQYK